SKLIKQNPYGEFGLVSWPTIRPRGIKDRAFAVLDRAAKPMHFREVAAAISKSGWSSKKAHPQTVHNELIKDPRFVLVGRGLYALANWGYESGTVSDVISSLLKSSKRPLSKEAIVESVLKSRFVKPNTVLLNLQNKTLFRKVAEGYALV
ncbi:winged helix-turn-helix domain-containing protein, partial [Candidatus Wolfebacteria bacterium]|nr:winged helix-turn-helix domain-containing protein [Candidatus Wolfebacteria bacterium]